MTKEMILKLKWSVCLIGLLGLGTVQSALGQCPTSEEVVVRASGEHTFSQNQGEISFSFKSVLQSGIASFRVRLYDTNKEQYVYDDNNPTFLNQVSAPTISGRVLTFSSLSTGKYELELHGGECQYQRYQVAITRE